MIGKSSKSVKHFRGQITRSYLKRIEEEAREGRYLPPPSWYVVWDVALHLLQKTVYWFKGYFILERKKLEKVQILIVYLEPQNDDKESLIKLLDLLHQRDRCSSLQLKRLEIGNSELHDDDDHLKPRLPSFEVFPGLHSLHLISFVIPENPGCGFQSLMNRVYWNLMFVILTVPSV